MRQTAVDIAGQQFRINGVPTYNNQSYGEHSIEGLLFNSRMVQALFDDENPETVGLWAYPGTGEWDPERNTREFVAMFPTFRSFGLLGITLNMQCGNPVRGRGPEGVVPEQPWRVSAYLPDGSLKPEWMERLRSVLIETDRLGMVVILGLFYFGQDQVLEDEAAVFRATDNILDWLTEHEFTNVVIEVANECNVPRYSHDVLKPDRIPELIRHVRATTSRPASASWASIPGDIVPGMDLVESVDFILLHGNSIKDPRVISEMISDVRVKAYRSGGAKPIVFNEDNNFNFFKPDNNFKSSVEGYASWGYFDPGEANDYNDGYQCPPVQWGLTTPLKRSFFYELGLVTGAVRAVGWD